MLEPCAEEFACTVLRGGKPATVYLSQSCTYRRLRQLPNTTNDWNSRYGKKGMPLNGVNSLIITTLCAWNLSQMEDLTGK